MTKDKKPIEPEKIESVNGNVWVIFERERNKPEKLISVKHAEILHKKGLISYK